MIGGTDVLIPTQAGVASLDACVRAVQSEWPQAVFEDAATGAFFDADECLSMQELSEMFAYRDHNAAQSWDKRGAAPELRNTMIHVLTAPGQLTVVVDDPTSPPIRRIVTSLKRELRSEAVNVPAQPEEGT
jgi:hypothetical protein